MSTVFQFAAPVVGACSYPEIDIGGPFDRALDLGPEFAAAATMRLKDYFAVLDGADFEPTVRPWFDDTGDELRWINGCRDDFFVLAVSVSASVDFFFGFCATF
jgi:hypothetical protein